MFGLRWVWTMRVKACWVPGRVALGCAAMVVLLPACAPDNRKQALPDPVHVEARDVVGVWRGWAGSQVAFRGDGSVSVIDLDGQEFQFDDNWRMSGTGSWKLLGRGEYSGGESVGGGQVVKVEIKRRNRDLAQKETAGEGRRDDVKVAGRRTAKPPATAEWVLGIAGSRAKPHLFFLTGDPDGRDTYLLRK